MTDDPNPADRVRRTVRLDPSGWLCLCRVADAYWEGKRYPAADAALLDAALGSTPFPAEPSPAFNASVAALVEVTAKRLHLKNKNLHYGADVAKAILDATATYPNVGRSPGSPLPFARRLPSGNPPVPTAPWALSIPSRFANEVPENGLRGFLDVALVAKAARLGLDRLPERVLPPPRALPSLDSVMTSRHLDEALVCILAALPLTAPVPSDRLLTTLRWLRSALAIRPVRSAKPPKDALPTPPASN